MTEDEAKTKWCPFVRVGMHGVNSSAGANRGIATAVDETVTCIGSLCMAWRITPNYAVKPSTGYCGLAGEP